MVIRLWITVWYLRSSNALARLLTITGFLECVFSFIFCLRKNVKHMFRHFNINKDRMVDIIFCYEQLLTALCNFTTYFSCSCRHTIQKKTTTILNMKSKRELYVQLMSTDRLKSISSTQTYAIALSIFIVLGFIILLRLLSIVHFSDLKQARNQNSDMVKWKHQWA